MGAESFSLRGVRSIRGPTGIGNPTRRGTWGVARGFSSAGNKRVEKRPPLAEPKSARFRKENQPPAARHEPPAGRVARPRPWPVFDAPAHCGAAARSTRRPDAAELFPAASGRKRQGAPLSCTRRSCWVLAPVDRCSDEGCTGGTLSIPAVHAKADSKRSITNCPPSPGLPTNASRRCPKPPSPTRGEGIQ